MIKKWKTDIRDDEVYKRRSRWPRRLRRRSAAARLLRLWARIPPVSRMFVVSVVCCQVEVSATSWSLLKRSPTDCGALLCVGLLLINRPRLRTLPPPHSYGNQRLQRQFDGLLMMGIVMPETCWAVSIRQGNKFHDWLLHLVGCFIRMICDIRYDVIRYDCWNHVIWLCTTSATYWKCHQTNNKY